MSKRYQADLIASEKPDPHESASVKFLAVPFTLWLALSVFGIGYLATQTKHTLIADGDKRSPKPTAVSGATVDPQLGANLYKTHCQACHQVTGAGVGTAFPPLVGSEWVLGDGETVAAIVLHGISGEIEVSGKTYKGVMPPFKSRLSAEDVAAVATYVRTSWGNQAEPVSIELVESVLQQTAERKSPWKGGAELKEASWTK